MYEVKRPVYEKTGETLITSEGKLVDAWRVASWVTVGIAQDMADANRRYPPGYWAKCYSWCLEEVKEIH